VTTFEIWCEGFRATGESGTAQVLGTARGETFEEACVTFFREEPTRHLFDRRALTYWGCKLFDNETDARRRFG
jgi:hypothetical protein